MLYRKYVLSYIKIFMGYGWGKVMATLGLGENGPKHTHESNAKWLKKKKSFVFEWQRVWQSNQDTVEGPEESSSQVMDTDGAKLVLDRRIVQLSSSSCRSHEHLVRISDRDCCCRRRPYKFIHFFHTCSLSNYGQEQHRCYKFSFFIFSAKSQQKSLQDILYCKVKTSNSKGS